MSHVDHPATGREKLGLHRLAVSSAESRYRTRHPWRRYEFDFVDVTTRPWSATVFMESADGERIDRLGWAEKSPVPMLALKRTEGPRLGRFASGLENERCQMVPGADDE